MLWPSVDFELFEHFASQPVPGHHPPYGQFEGISRVALQLVTQTDFLQAPHIPRVAVIHFLIHLAPGYPDLFSIDYDHKVPRIEVRAVSGFVLALEDVRYLRRQSPQSLSRGVHQEPFAFNLAIFDYKSFHLDTPSITYRHQA